MAAASQASVTLASVAAVTAELGSVAPSWLSDQEKARCDGFKAPKRRLQFVAGRYLARQCLAAWAGGTWQDYLLSAPEGAAPFVTWVPDPQNPGAAGRSEIHVSLSHSADWLACAVASFPVGVDIEDCTRPRDTDALGELVLSDDEMAEMAAASPQVRREHFYARWTLKEAWIKQLGAAAPATMRALQCFPCQSAQSQGVVLSCDAFTLAVMPARPHDLILKGLVPSGLAMQPWRLLLSA